MNIVAYSSKIAILLCVLCIGIVFKRSRLIPQNAFDTLAPIVSNFTLPCAILSSCRSFSLGLESIAYISLGIVINLILLAVAWFQTRYRENEKRLFYMLNMSALNIGNFSVPLLTNSEISSALPAIFFFDLGNALMGCGGNYTISTVLVSAKQNLQVRTIVKQLSHSICFDLYLILILFSLLHIKIPNIIYEFSDSIAESNSVLVMFLFGIGVNLHGDRKYFCETLRFFWLRYIVLIGLSFLVILMPFSHNTLIGLAISVLSPVSTMSVLFTKKSGGDYKYASALASVSIFVSFGVVCVCLPCWIILLKILSTTGG